MSEKKYDGVKTAELYRCHVPYLHDFFAAHEYPWQMLPDIGALCAALLKDPPVGFSEYAPGILTGENVKIDQSAVLLPPVVLGEGTEVRPGAYLRGNIVTGRNCVIGNSTELKNTILLDGAQLPHYNYAGDSILGNHAHMGAGAVCSNLKADGKTVVVHGVQDYATNLRKCGGMLGDGADAGCGCVLNPGSVIGKNTSVYPLTAVRGVVPEDSIVKNSGCIVKKRERGVCVE